MPQSSPRASRLATPHWLDARLVIGVVLVLLAVVAGARVFARADRETPVYVARHPLVPGEQLAPSDLAVGQVRFNGEGGSYISAAGAAPVGYVVTRLVDTGELVPLAALAPSRGPADPNRLVTVPVVPGHLPDGLGHGDLVDVYVTPKSTASGAVAVPVRVLTSVPVDSDNAGALGLTGGSTVSVVLAVPAAQVTVAIHAVESGTIDVVGVPAAAAGPAPSPPTSPGPTPATGDPSPGPASSGTSSPIATATGSRR